ncbi:hypothetical protein CYMTET_6669 [Cymbomonas tetramitiformis]|uniref:CMP/dCMP-type deaminase domain-containing protein n=1 Tax=Cymbomonas tetramitiformis TaxID=36881 RepID=A0AAE0GX08_9CHLO|nr:hypothetical protein CYMTET_6669 [Cymbomonas tetramitiformis]
MAAQLGNRLAPTLLDSWWSRPKYATWATKYDRTSTCRAHIKRGHGVLAPQHFGVTGLKLPVSKLRGAEKGHAHRNISQKRTLGAVSSTLNISETEADNEAGETARKLVKQAVAEGRFVFEREEVDAFKQMLNMTDSQLCEHMISPATKLARPPISGYYVGAVGMGESGRVYLGVNLEFSRLPMQMAVHAEQFMVANALRMKERAIVRLAVSAAPCGHCRQFMAELPRVDAMEIKVINQPTMFLPELLPARFGPEDLLHDSSTPRLLEDRHNGLTLTAAAAALCLDEDLSAIGDAALDAANSAYTPYSECPSGLAVRTACGSVYQGGAVESCAYNPGMSPLQTTLVAALAEGGHRWEEMQTAVLVELPGAPVQHAEIVELVLKRIAPNARLVVLSAER